MSNSLLEALPLPNGYGVLPADPYDSTSLRAELQPENTSAHLQVATWNVRGASGSQQKDLVDAELDSLKLDLVC